MCLDLELSPEKIQIAILAFEKAASKSVQVLLNGIEAVMVLTLMILKKRNLVFGLPKFGAPF